MIKGFLDYGVFGSVDCCGQTLGHCRRTTCLKPYMGGCQNYGPFLGP